MILKEEFVDENYKIKELTKKDKAFYLWLQANFEIEKGVIETNNGYLYKIPISLKQIKEKSTLPHPLLVQTTRRLWKGGKLRRFYTGNWQGAKYPETYGKVGSKYGIYYLW